MQKSSKRIENNLKERAKVLAHKGYSVIPVSGNKLPKEPKKPAIPWRAYQRRIADEAEIDAFFTKGVTGLGIVCGTVSRLLVIDFDDHLRYQRFCRHLPQYAGAYTVKTRRGYHVYFRSDVKVPSHQFAGGDIKGERSYVIAAASIIGDVVYREVRREEPMDIAKEDVDKLLSYFHVNAGEHRLPGKVLRTKGDLDLQAVYARLAPEIGRNNALFRCASLGRDSGLTQASLESQLISVHVKQEGSANHKVESARERWQEGERTIASAFRQQRSLGQSMGGLPNSVRELLLSRQKSTVVVRLLDSLVLAGWESDGFFTLKDAIQLGEEYGLNRKSVMQALTGELSSFNGRHIISRRYVDYLDIEGLKSRKRGRPLSLVFQVPGVTRLLSVCGVGASPSDPVISEDLKSAASYRRALHRAYIRRLSPRSTMSGLAARIGVVARTIRRYNEALGVNVRPLIARLKLTGRNLTCLPKRRRGADGKATKGFWLELADGTRMPAWRHMGSRLLKGSVSSVDLCWRRGSTLSIGGSPSAGAEYITMTVQDFAQTLIWRGLKSYVPGFGAKLGGLVDEVKRRVSRVRYGRVALFFDSVIERIADDKVAGSIGAYLVAYDDLGSEVRRPARRGIAFRMLKEFGNGKVFLALRRSLRDVSPASSDEPKGSDGLWFGTGVPARITS